MDGNRLNLEANQFKLVWSAVLLLVANLSLMTLALERRGTNFLYGNILAGAVPI